MLEKYSIFLMLLLMTASLVGIGSIYLTSAEAQPQQRSGPMVGKITHTIVYASNDGKACIANARITSNPVNPSSLGLKPGTHIMLLAIDESICDSLRQASIAQQEIDFRVAPSALSIRLLPAALRADFASTQDVYRVIEVILGPGPI
jgi:hypothetical protein